MDDTLYKKLELLKQKKRLKDSLPHLYGFDWYPFQEEFLETRKEIQVMCCANQIGKTTVLCAKLVRLATDIELWGKLWKDEPKYFIYLLPTQKLHNSNAESKWLSVLPKNEMRYESEQYGWEWIRRGKDYTGIKFNNGVQIIFSQYSQRVTNLQSITAHLVAFDEEPDWHMTNEVTTRTNSIPVAEENMINAWAGFKIFAFTATKSQSYFREIIEERGPKERWPVSQGNVWKKTVSLYECQKHASGKKSIWTDKKIKQAIKMCTTDAEVARRIYGRFQASEDLVYPQFSRTSNLRPNPPDLTGYNYYAGIDYGSGGSAHSSSIVIVAVSPDYTLGFVTDVWIGDDGNLTTCSDVVDKYVSMVGQREISGVWYDYAAKDLYTFASRRGLPFQRANKDHKVGEGLLNALFKNCMLYIVDEDYHANTLITQLTTFVKLKKLKKIDDDGIDALRYCVSSIPWDLANSEGGDKFLKAEVKKEVAKKFERLNRDGTPRMGPGSQPDSSYSLEQEVSEWGGYFEF